MSKLHVVAAIIEGKDGLVLIAQRPPGKDLEGYWEFPGGKIEQNEEPRDALVRELKEELELDVDILSQLGFFAFAYAWGEIALHVFIVKSTGIPKVTNSVHVFKWVVAEHIREDELAPADREPLKQYLSQVRSG